MTACAPKLFPSDPPSNGRSNIYSRWIIQFAELYPSSTQVSPESPGRLDRYDLLWSSKTADIHRPRQRISGNLSCHSEAWRVHAGRGDSLVPPFLLLLRLHRSSADGNSACWRTRSMPCRTGAESPRPRSRGATRCSWSDRRGQVLPEKCEDLPGLKSLPLVDSRSPWHWSTTEPALLVTGLRFAA